MPKHKSIVIAVATNKENFFDRKFNGETHPIINSIVVTIIAMQQTGTIGMYSNSTSNKAYNVKDVIHPIGTTTML